MSYPAHSVDDAYDACHPEEPLKSGDPRYVDLTVARGNENLAQTVTLRISRTKPPRFHQQLVSGHRGCGKSTELRQLQAKLQDSGFFVVYLDAEETLDLGEIKKTTARLLHCVWFRNTRTANAGPNCIRRFARSRAFRSASDRSMKS